MSADRIYFFQRSDIISLLMKLGNARVSSLNCANWDSEMWYHHHQCQPLCHANLPPHKYSECHSTLRFPFAEINSPHMRMHKDAGKLMSSRIDFIPSLVGLTVSGVPFRSISVSAFYPRPLLFFLLPSIQPIPKRCICPESRKNWPTTHFLYHRKKITFKFQNKLTYFFNAACWKPTVYWKLNLNFKEFLFRGRHKCAKSCQVRGKILVRQFENGFLKSAGPKIIRTSSPRPSRLNCF